MRPTLLAIEAPLRDTGSMTSARGTTASTGAPGRPLRALFVNENLGGHASMHLYIRQALADVPELEGNFVDVPRAGWIRKLLAAPVPGLATHDLDLQPLRAQLLQSMWVRRLLARAAQSYDVVHVYTQSTALLSAPQLAAGPTVVSTDGTATQNAYHLPYRSPTRHTASQVRIARRFEDRVYAAATLVVAQSEWAADSLRSTYGVDADRIRVIPFGVPMPPPVSRQEAEGLPKVTFVGKSLERKGGLRLLDTFRQHLRGRCELNLVTLEPVASEPGVRVHNDFTPGDRRLLDLLAASAVFAFPSEMDNSPYSVLEAMVAALPVVTTRVGGIPEMVLDGETGLLVGRDNAELAAAIGTLLDDADLRRKMGDAARRRAEERFDAAHTTRRLAEVLREARERF
jgi:glycosyltransferase involved in cell wall biosynthesis